MLLMEELGEQGDMLGYGMCGAGRCWGVIEFAHAVSASKFFEDGSDGGGIVCVIVGVLAADGL